MLTALHLGNFKAFSDTQKTPIRPLTLIFGANSSGKSSLIHGLLLAHEAMWKGKLDVHRTELGGDSVDLGGFRQYVHRRDAGLQVEWALEISKDSFTDRLNELLPDVDRITLGITIGLGKFARSLLEGFEKLTPKAFWDVLIETAREKGDQSSAEKYEKEREGKRDFITFEDISKIEGEVHIETFWLDIGTNRLLSMSYRTEGHLRLDILDQEHGVMKYLVLSIIRNMTTTDEIDDKDREALTEAVDELVPKISSKVEKFFPIKLFKEESEIATSRQIALSTIGKERRKENLKEATEYYLPGIIQEIVLGLSEIIENEISRLTYLGPLRSYPPRHIAFSQYHDPNWQAGGGYAWDTVLRNSRVRSAVNSWLGDNEKLSTSYELKVKNLLTINDIESKLNELISKGADKFHENYSEYTESDEDIFW
ncbi:AAA family ATPase, partial [bacterium]|nr:AAA family ATPase [bacterium]